VFQTWSVKKLGYSENMKTSHCPRRRHLACWDRRFKSRRGYGVLSLASVVCSHVDIPTSGWSVVWRSSIECNVSEYDREASIMGRPWPPKGCCPMEGGKMITPQTAWTDDIFLRAAVSLTAVASCLTFRLTSAYHRTAEHLNSISLVWCLNLWWTLTVSVVWVRNNGSELFTTTAITTA